MPDDPDITALTAMKQSDLRLMVAELLGDGLEDADADPDAPAIISAQNSRVLLVVRRVRIGAPALAGISLPGLADTARQLGLTQAVAATTGNIDPERRGDLNRALDKLGAATGVAVRVLDGGDLLTEIANNLDARRRFFPDASDTARVAAASSAPKALVMAATRVAPQPAHGLRPWHGIARLVCTVGITVGLIAIPLPMSAHDARIVAIVGLAFLSLTLALGAISSWLFGRASARLGAQLIQLLAPVPDSTAVLRRILLAKPSDLALLGMIVAIAWLRAARSLLVSGILVFFALFAFGYMLLWSFDPAPCVGSGSCPGAFASLGTLPSLGDFVYLAAQGAFFNVPGDVAATSRLSRALLTGEFIAAAALLVGFAASLGMPDGLWSPTRLKQQPHDGLD